jgi:hypothetical protein
VGAIGGTRNNSQMRVHIGCLEAVQRLWKADRAWEWSVACGRVLAVAISSSAAAGGEGRTLLAAVGHGEVGGDERERQTAESTEEILKNPDKTK